MAERIALTVNGRRIAVDAGCSAAAAALEVPAWATRTSVSGEPRGPLCGMGVCFECRMTVDGVAHQRTCMMQCRDGMVLSSEPAAPAGMKSSAPTKVMDVNILIIGAGPAGLAAASRAAQAGRRVAMVDDNPCAGGQIWRHNPTKPASKFEATWLAALQRDSVQTLAQTQVIGYLDPSSLLAESPQGPFVLRFQKLILATGARERFLPFPGWTLPGAFGAGGLQALVKAGFSVGSRRVIVAGSGPLVLAVASFLLDHGAYVPLIAEQAPRGRLLRFAGSLLWQQPFKLLEALALRWKTRGTSYRTGCWPIRAVGHKRLESVTLTDGVRTWTEPCDALACGYGLVPNLELPMVLGCAIERGFVKVDEVQRTSIPNVYAVGELTGIGGLDKALIEGQIAGWAAAERASDLQAMMRQRSKYDRFVNALESTFSLRDELRRLGDDATIVCRCEDVHFGALKRFTNWRDAKLQTRCGMGPCQGRICGPAVDFLFGWPNDSVRPPIFPTALGNLISEPPA